MSRWIERWNGSPTEEGWSIMIEGLPSRDLVAHLGPQVSAEAVSAIVAAHNEALDAHPQQSGAAPDPLEALTREQERLGLYDWQQPGAAQPEQERKRNDGMPLSPTSRHLRRLLAVRSGMQNTYLDDGEAHGQEHGISIDFMRELPSEIDAKLRALRAARGAAAQPEVQERKPLSAREVELIDGMIKVQLLHAQDCDRIANRVMAEKQKGWDMERVELLRKLKAAHGIKE